MQLITLTQAGPCSGQGMYFDIYCGEVYQHTTGKDDPQEVISRLYHIDGAPTVKLMNLWPVQCFVVELPPKPRYCFSVFLALQKNQI